MPQILWLSSRKNLSTVGLLSAGDDQAAICDPIIYLEATISGDLTGHTTLWEQVSGTPTVDLIIVDATRAYYLVAGLPGSDKVFRFYVDKNTSSEQYLDVNIRTTPFSSARTLENGSGGGRVEFPSVAFVQAFRSTVTAPFDYTIPFNSQGEYVTGTAVLTYALPEAFYQTQTLDNAHWVNRFMYTLVDRWNGSTWQNMQITNYTDMRQIQLDTGERIRIGAMYTSPNGPTPVYSQWYDFSAESLSGGTVVNTIENGAVTGSHTVSRVVFTLVLQSYDETLSTIENGASTGVPTIIRTVFSLIPQTYDENISQLENGVTAGKYTLTRVTGGTIGG